MLLYACYIFQTTSKRSVQTVLRIVRTDTLARRKREREKEQDRRQVDNILIDRKRVSENEREREREIEKRKGRIIPRGGRS